MKTTNFMKKINNQTLCPKIDIYVNGVYFCSTDFYKTLKQAKESILKNGYYTAKEIKCKFDTY